MTLLVGLAALVGCSENTLKVEPGTPTPTDAPVPTDEPEPEPEPTPAPNTPDIEVDTYELDFGVLPPICDASGTITVSNVGDALLEVTALNLNGFDTAFTVLSSPLNLQPGESFPIDVAFEPDGTRSYFEAIDIVSNDPDEGVVQVTLVGEGDVIGQITEEFVQAGTPQPIDILFVLDNSTSMQDTNTRLQNNFNLFIQGFLTLNLDYQIGIVTTDMQTPGYIGALQGPLITTATPNPIQQFNTNTNIPFTQVLEEQGLDAVQAALTAPLITGVNAGLVRPNSLLSVIVISDEDDQSVNASPTDIITLLDTYQGDPDLTSLSIVGGPRQGLLPCGNLFSNAAPVPTYWQVAQATGGIHLNLCNLDMSEIVTQLAVVAAGLETSFPLSNTPPDPWLVEVTVDGVPVPIDPANGWTYDAPSNSVQFHGTAMPPLGSTVRVMIPDAVTCP